METVHLMPSDIAGALDLIASVTEPALLPQARFVKRFGYMVCTICNLDAKYCKGHAPAETPAKDGAESSLERRARECMGGK